MEMKKGYNLSTGTSDGLTSQERLQVYKDSKKEITSKDSRAWLYINKVITFNFSNLVLSLKTELKKKYPGDSKEDTDIRVGKSLETYTTHDTKQKFEYISFDNWYGGKIWYVICPKCGSRSKKLFLPKGVKDREQSYQCMTCHKIKTAVPISKKRKKEVVNPLKELKCIETKLLTKNKFNSDEIKTLLDRHHVLEESLKGSVEYRLWKFRNERKI